ncbi:MAG: tRNA threonylcarbamoyladenosine dehydratase [Gammaproteobacteria bacterium]|jgi:tRNA threonylcarbamoyladenosine dehydratase
MTETRHERTLLLLGEAGLERLAGTHVVIAGLGGVGGFAAEAVARAGVGRITLLDHDVVAPSNLNRQLLALESTLGRPKAEVMAERIRDINPHIRAEPVQTFLSPDNVGELVANARADYLLDCIDSISCKAALVHACQRQGLAVASSMGAGGRIDVTRALVSRLDRTHTCPLAREMRRHLKRLGASLRYPVVFSTEIPRKGSSHQPVGSPDNPGRPRAVNGTISYLPALFGIMLAGVAIQALLDAPQ